MLYIPCSSECFYQQDGCCRLEHAGAAVTCTHCGRCPHYVNRSNGVYLPPRDFDNVSYQVPLRLV